MFKTFSPGLKDLVENPSIEIDGKTGWGAQGRQRKTSMEVIYMVIGCYGQETASKPELLMVIDCYQDLYFIYGY